MHQGIYKGAVNMEKKILNISTVVLVVVTVMVVVSGKFLPDLRKRSVLAQEIRLQQSIAVQHELEHVDSIEEEEPIEEKLDGEKGLIIDSEHMQEHTLRIELPIGMNYSDVSVYNEYLTGMLYVKFPYIREDFFSLHRVFGNSSDILSLVFYKEGERGVIAARLKQFYEVREKYNNGFLELTFVSPRELYEKIVVIDAGHGGDAPGAVKNGIKEKDIDLLIVKQLKSIFDVSQDKIGVYYTRLDDTNPSFEHRVGLANRVGADLFISVHNNSSGNGRYSSLNGTLVMYKDADTSEFSSKKFANICLKETTEMLGSKNNGLLKGDEIYIIRNSQVPVALIEVGFMTNQEELKKLNTEEYQRKAARGIYDSIIKAFEEGF